MYDLDKFKFFDNLIKTDVETQNIIQFKNYLCKAGFAPVSDVISKVNSEVEMIPTLTYDKKYDIFILRYFDDNKIVVQLKKENEFDDRYSICSYYFSFVTETGYSVNEYKDKTFFYTLNDNRYKQLPSDEKIIEYIETFNKNIDTYESLKSITPMTFKAEISLYGTNELKVIALFEKSKKLAIGIGKIKEFISKCHHMFFN